MSALFNKYRLLAVFAFVIHMIVANTMITFAGGMSWTNAGIGGVWPQGSFARYADPGVNLMGRISFDLPLERTVSFWGGFNYSVFSIERSMVQAVGLPGTPPFMQEITRHGGTFHAGFQLGLSSGIIRPRATVGLGYYFFFTETSLTDVNSSALEGEESPIRRFDDIQGRPGWRGLAGLDIIVSSKWGISLDFFQDTIWRLRSTSGDENHIATSRFLGFAVGVVIPFQSLKEHLGNDEWEPKDLPIDKRKN